MNPTAVVFWGATGQAKVARDILRDAGVEVLAVVDNNPDVSPPFEDIPLLAGWPGLTSWLAARKSPETLGFLVAIGGALGKDRVDLHDRLTAAGLVSLSAVHRTAFVASTAVLGSGSQVHAQAAVCVDAVLGRSCIINTAASVDHDCRLGDGVHLGPGARLAGHVTVDRYSTIFTGACVGPRVHIGEGATVGAGSVVLRDVPAGVVVAGNPARIMRSHVPVTETPR